MAKSIPLRKKELYNSNSGGTCGYDGKSTPDEKSIGGDKNSKPTTDAYGESLGKKSWKGTEGRKNWK